MAPEIPLVNAMLLCEHVHRDTASGKHTLFAVFELSDLNGINDNSIVLVDSVVILIPEPQSALFAGLAALLVLLINRRRR